MLPRPVVVLLLGGLVVGCAGSPTASRPAATTAPRTAEPTTAPATPAAPAVTAVPSLAAPSPVRTIRPPRTRTSPHRFPIAGCAATYGRSHHDYPATDVFAARGCVVVSPVDGRIDEVSARDSWDSTTNRAADRGGLSFSVIGVDGVRYYGSHLQAVEVRPGQQVRAGQRVGTVGNTGNARGTATHVHFGISWPTRPGVWWVRRGEVYPWPYLDAWRAGQDKSPAAAVAAERRRQGDVPECRIDC